MHLYRSNNFWKAPWKSSCVNVSMTFVTASFISSIVSWRQSLSLGNNQRSKGARSGLLGGWGLCWCQSWSNSLWQEWSCGLVHYPAGNPTDPIWRVLAPSDGVCSWTPLKPQHSIPCWLSSGYPVHIDHASAVKKRDHQKFVGGFGLSVLLGSWRVSMLPLGTLSLGHWVIAVDPAFIAWHFFQI